MDYSDNMVGIKENIDECKSNKKCKIFVMDNIEMIWLQIYLAMKHFNQI